MNKFSPNRFFDLKDFQYPQIFDGIEEIWEAIPRIEKFIKKRTNKILVGKGTKIDKTAVILGPAIIGKNCYIGPHAFLRENCIISDNCHIGHGVEIKNSLLLPGARPAHLNYIGDSMLGKDVIFAGGSITANFRLDKKSVTIKDHKTKINTGLPKFGAVVGDGSFIGVNSVLNPGTILGKNTIVYPLTSVVGVHKNNEVIK